METVQRHRNNQRSRGRLLLPEERRAYSVKPGFTEREMEILEKRAEAVGLPVAEFIRRLAIRQPIHAVPSINREAVIELRRIGNNINQATRQMNRQLDEVEHNDFRSDLLMLRNLLNAMTSLLLIGSGNNGDQQTDEG